MLLYATIQLSQSYIKLSSMETMLYRRIASSKVKGENPLSVNSLLPKRLLLSKEDLPMALVLNSLFIF